MCLNIQCDEKSEKFYKIFLELNKALIRPRVKSQDVSSWYDVLP